MAILGNKIYITLGGTKIAALKACKVNTSNEVIEIASTSASRWREYVAGRLSWSMSCTWLVLSSAAMKSNMLRTGQVYTITFTDGTAAGTLRGTAICTKADGDANIHNLANGSFQFQGTGPLL